MLRVAMMLMILFVGSQAASAEAEGTPKTVLGVDSFAGKVVLDQPIEMNIDVKGVKLQSIYFSDKKAMVILWNRRPKSVGVNVDVVLVDAKGKVVAVGKRPASLMGGSIRAGKQSNFNFDFGGYITDMSQVTAYSVVFSAVGDGESNGGNFAAEKN